MEDIIILDLCGGTGAWSKPYKDAGCDVRVITLPKYSVDDVDLLEDRLVFYSQSRDPDHFEVPISKIAGILAAPPCTMFSMARNTAKTPRDLVGAMKTVENCLKIIWHCQTGGRRLQFWAMENPMGRLRWFMGKPAMTFQPWEFGHGISKKTDLWGNFNTNLKRTPVPINPTLRKHSQQNSSELPPIPSDYVRDPGMRDKRSIQRSITPQGFAQEFYKANTPIPPSTKVQGILGDPL